MSVRILHAADLHLDSPFEALSGAQAAQRRREQRDLLRALPELAKAHGAQIILLAGDLLDSASPYPETAKALAETFAGCASEVFLAPGNHDYYSAGAPYARLTFPENVHIFRTQRIEAVALPELGVRVWGAAFTDSRCPALLRGFSVPKEPGLLDVLCMHAEVGNPASAYNPVSAADLAHSGLDYAAFGHTHRFGGVQRAGGTVYAWPGCMEGRGFDETGEKGVLLVDVAAGDVQAQFLPVPGRRYEILRVDVTDADPVQAVCAALPEGAARNIFRIVLTPPHCARRSRAGCLRCSCATRRARAAISGRARARARCADSFSRSSSKNTTRRTPTATERRSSWPRAGASRHWTTTRRW